MDNTTIKSVKRLSDGAQLGALKSSYFARFEDPGYIEEWYDEKKELSEIQLPRFHLTFKSSHADRQKLACTQYPGWIIDSNQTIPQLGTCDYYLVLTNSKGKIRVILPKQTLKTHPTENVEVLEAVLDRQQHLKDGEIVQFEHALYEMDANKKLKPHSIEDAFHLAKALAANHEYVAAAYYLRQYGEKLSAYSAKELETLEDILEIRNTTGDVSGEQTGIALYTAYLLSTNQATSKKGNEFLRELYTDYLNLFNNITSLKLTTDEELRLVKNLLADCFDDLFYVRLRELDPQYASTVLKKGEKEQVKLVRPSLISFLSSINTPDSNYPVLTPLIESNTIITRSKNAIIKYLCGYVNNAINGTAEQKKWLRDACVFLRNQHKDELAQALALLFQQILDNPEKFPVPPEPTGIKNSWENFDLFHKRSEELLKWWIDTITKVQLINPTSSISSISPVVDLTPEHYRLEKSEALLPKVDFSFEFTPVPPLTAQRNFNQLFDPIAAQSSAQKHDEFKNWLKNQGQHVSALDDPMQSQEWTRLSHDLNTFQAAKPKTSYALKQPLENLQQALLDESAENSVHIAQLHKNVLHLANRFPSDPDEEMRARLNFLGGVQKDITLDDVLVSFGQKNPQLLQKMNPSLDQKDIHDLYTNASLFLQAKVQEQQRERCLKTYEKLAQLDASASPTERIELENKLAEQLNAKQHYDPAKHPTYTVFEYYADILMHSSQIEKLDTFLNGKDSNPIMEMIMGSGKSKVLLPLLGLLRADGKCLSMVVVPAPLFESVASDTQLIQKSFAKPLRTLHFDRNTTFSKRSLEEIRDIMTKVISNKECLIMTSKSIKSLLLKFIEQSDQAIQNGVFLDEEVELMTEIIDCLNQCGNPLLDEADTVLNVLHEVSFSLGHRTEPKSTEILIVSKIYSLLYTDPNLKALAQLESDPHPNQAAPPLTETLYFEKLQKPLVDAYLTRLQTKGLQNKELDDELHKLFCSGVDKQLLIDYLCRNKDNVAHTQKFYKSLSPQLKDMFSLLSEEFSRLLPHSLTRISDEKYGLDDGVIATPYSATNTPSHGSFYSNAYVTMNYTFQIHFKKGIDQETILKQVQLLKKQAEQEVDESGGNKLLNETKGWKLFSMLTSGLDIPFHNQLSEVHLAAIEKSINNDPHFKGEIISTVFLPQLELFEEKLSCNPIGFTSLFSKKISGFTGTLWVAGSIHRKLTPIPEQGTDARTLSLLWNMSKSEDSVKIIPKGSLTELMKTISSQKFEMIIDTGGYFKEGGNLSIARKMAVEFGKPFVFYNKWGEQTITDGHKEMPLAQSKLTEKDRLTFLDQSHTTGADVPQKEGAVGLVTIGRNMLLRDLLQSVWRLRGLEKGQQVKFLIDQEVESIIRQKLNLAQQQAISFADILKFVVQNQSKQQGDDNFKAFKQQLWSLPQNALINSLLGTEDTAQTRMEAFKLLRETWIKPATQSPSALYGAPVLNMPSEGVLKEEGEKCKAFIRNALVKLPQLNVVLGNAITEIDDLVKHTKKIVHPLVVSPATDDAETVEVEQSLQVETATEVLTETDQQGKDVNLGCFWGSSQVEVKDIEPKRFEDRDVQIFPLNMQLKRESALNEYATLFDDIKISINVLEWKDKEEDLSKFYLLGANRTPFHHLKVHGNDVTLLTKEEYIKDKNDYFNLHLGFYDTERKLNPKAFEKICKIKFLNGDSNYSLEEIAFLEKWITEAGPKKMQNFFMRHILHNQQLKAVNYSGSALQRLFQKLTKNT